MKIEELRAMNETQLRAELLKLRKKEFESRMQLRTGQLARNDVFKKTRRDIARIKTVQAQRRQGENP